MEMETGTETDGDRHITVTRGHFRELGGLIIHGTED